MTFDRELGILFLHHRTCEVTVEHFRLLKQWNPEAAHIPLTTSLKGLDGAFGPLNLSDFAREQARNPGVDWNLRSAADVLVCAWYRQREIRCARWLIVEWDVWCGCSVMDYFKEVWDLPFVAPSVRWRNREPEWAWWAHLHHMPEEAWPFAAGIVPFTPLLIRDDVLSAVAAAMTSTLSGNVMCELRFPTLAYQAGFTPAANPKSDWRITWTPHEPNTKLDATFWHPIKWLAKQDGAGLATCGPFTSETR